MSLWLLAWRRFLGDPVGVASAAVVLAFIAVAAASALGWVARDWSEEVGVSYAPPRFLGGRGNRLELSESHSAKRLCRSQSFPGIQNPFHSFAIAFRSVRHWKSFLCAGAHG